VVTVFGSLTWALNFVFAPRHYAGSQEEALIAFFMTVEKWSGASILYTAAELCVSQTPFLFSYEGFKSLGDDRGGCLQ
jgi:hypothetical protein